MADITVRKLRFQFEDAFGFPESDQEFSSLMSMLGLSLTMPYLEPYLIRTMRVALGEILDPQLREDVQHFSQQEGHHYRNHAKFNERVRAQFPTSVADQILAIEHAMEADYQRFTREKSLRFNVAYAEGFEAMTCSSALAMAEHGDLEGSMMPGGELWAWHMAEEIEHRTVAFDVYQHLVGSYWYRILRGTWSQWHYLAYIGRFSRTMALALDRKLVLPRSPTNRTLLRRFLHTWSPRYDPAKIEIPPAVDALLARYSKMATRAAR